MKKHLSKLRKAIPPLRGFTLMSATLMLAACGENPPPTKPPVPQTAPLFQPEREALDKARGVGDAMTNSAEELKREEQKQAQ